MTNKSKKIDKKPIAELSSLLDELNLTEISYQDGDFAVSVSRVSKDVFNQSPVTDNSSSVIEKTDENKYDL